MTNLYQKFLSIFSFEARNITSKEDQNKISSLSIFLLLGLVLGSLYLIYSKFLNETTMAMFAGLVLIFSCIVYFIGLLITLKHKFFSYLFTTTVGLLFMSYFIFGTENEILWFYLFPALTLFLLGLESGMIFSLIVFVFAVAMFFLEGTIFERQIYTTDFKIKFSLAYLAVFAISFTYEYVRKSTRKKLINSLEDFRRANETNKMKADFLVQLSHQIRTPLSSITGLVNILKNSDLTQEQLELLDGINTSANNIVSVVKNISTITEINVEKDIQDVLTIHPESIIEQSFIEIKKNHKRLNFHTSINISTFLPDKLIGNPERFRILLQCVYNNILHHARRRSIEIDVYVNNKKETDDAVEIMVEVHTSSVKISKDLPENIERVFDFSTSQDTVGLDIKRKNINQRDPFDIFDFTEAKKIIESYGGSTGIKINESNTTIFWFTVVLWKQDVNLSKFEKIQNSNFSEDAVAPKKKKLSEATVMIVEDNLMNQKVISLALKGKIGNLEIANNGKEAIRIFANSKIDLILMDIQMPVMDGYKTASKIKELEIGTDIHTPIIALTANALQGDKEKCLSFGMDDYVSKPFQIDKLIEKMENLLNP